MVFSAISKRATLCIEICWIPVVVLAIFTSPIWILPFCGYMIYKECKKQ